MAIWNIGLTSYNNGNVNNKKNEKPKKKRKEKEMRIRSWRTGQKTTLSIRDGKNENKEEKLPQRNYVAKRLN